MASTHDRGFCHSSINPLVTKGLSHPYHLDDLVWLLFNIPVNNFSVMLGRSHCFLGIYQYFGELKVSCSRTQHGGRGIQTQDLSIQSLTLYHLATVPSCHLDESIFIIRGIRSDFSFLFHFVSKQNSPISDAAFCGITSWAILFAYVQ